MINNQKTTAIVLCGGLGTRLRSISGELPKPMVEVAGRPFLEYLLDNLIEQGISKAILAVSFQKEWIINYFGDQYKSLKLTYSVESTPLGTGGAIKKAMALCKTNSQPILVLNGDTLVDYDLSTLKARLKKENTKLVMSVKSINDTGRYGRVFVKKNTIRAFEEKKSGQSGFINTGVYLINKELAQRFPHARRFSFEKDFLEKQVDKNLFSIVETQGYFIDIGIPEDYHKAQKDFSAKPLVTAQR